MHCGVTQSSPLGSPVHCMMHAPCPCCCLQSPRLAAAQLAASPSWLAARRITWQMPACRQAPAWSWRRQQQQRRQRSRCQMMAAMTVAMRAVLTLAAWMTTSSRMQVGWGRAGLLAGAMQRPKGGGCSRQHSRAVARADWVHVSNQLLVSLAAGHHLPLRRAAGDISCGTAAWQEAGARQPRRPAAQRAQAQEPGCG